MLTAEKLVQKDFKKSIHNHENPGSKNDHKDKVPSNAKWSDAIIPVISLIIGAFTSLFYTGSKANPGIWSNQEFGFWFKVIKVIGDSDSFKALLWASLFALGVALLITQIRRSLNLRKSVEAIIDGFKSMLMAILILILAWTLALVIEDLNTATYLSDIVGENIPIFLFSTMVFIISALISFATGSSWGTMALLYPIILPTSFYICRFNGLENPEMMKIFYQVVAGVLGGSVFGDHCSPISDTTILSSMASKCNHIRHVKTQLPYALTVGLISSLLGYLFVSITGVSPIWALLLSSLVILTVILLFGKDISKFNKVQ